LGGGRDLLETKKQMMIQHRGRKAKGKKQQRKKRVNIAATWWKKHTLRGESHLTRGAKKS